MQQLPLNYFFFPYVQHFLAVASSALYLAQGPDTCLTDGLTHNPAVALQQLAQAARCHLPGAVLLPDLHKCS